MQYIATVLDFAKEHKSSIFFKYYFWKTDFKTDFKFEFFEKFRGLDL